MVTPFPGQLLFHDALLEAALNTGKKYTGTTRNMMYLQPKSSDYLAEMTPEILKRIEDWIENPYDAEAWAKAEAEKAGTHLNKE
ncbi:hypothetical protein CCAX7_53720 [Capsulimonas corticalis]|uniref:Uncharacterized protein n=1 Tax=Capsulimonas corticalis TaxID=2219043 RepID=A0A402CND9_9BACT|nr:hypothetical protein [Capsulimonas corticalis]BDI33321.1 hypothetical protein CCAX7_53720 [Capsulimonas corticalis]